MEFGILPLMPWAVSTALFMIFIFFRSEKGFSVFILLGVEALILGIVYYCITNNALENAVILVFNGSLMVILSFRYSFKVHFSILTIATFCMIFLLMQAPQAVPTLFILETLFIFIFAVTAFSLLLRHDIENHHIIKHRLGKESRRVEVSRLLNSKKVLDRDLSRFILVNSGIIAISTIVLTWIIFPILPSTAFSTNTVKRGFPSLLDLNQIGKISLSEGVRLVATPLNDMGLRKRIYFKGRSLTHYTNGRWFSPEIKLKPGSKDLPDQYKLKWSVKQYLYLNHGFAPKEASWIVLNTKKQLVNSSQEGVFWFKEKIENPSYSIYESSEISNKFLSLNHNKYLQLPENINKRVVSLGKSLSKGKSNPEDVISSINQFLKTFKYSEDYGSSASSSKDPVERFLFETKKGPCGLFASSAAILLRIAGLKSRIILGFSGGKKRGGDILLRGRDAHSWVEVYIEHKGWVTMDPTVSRRIYGNKTTKNQLRSMVIRIVPISILFILISLYLINRVNKKTVKSKEPSTVRGTKGSRAPSITTFQASMIFHDLITSLPLTQFPRKEGESAVNYALRLKEENHTLASTVFTASNLANSILFAGLTQLERDVKMEELKAMKTDIIQNQEQ
jgi:transglutaminase-like putative cysteine protease